MTESWRSRPVSKIDRSASFAHLVISAFSTWHPTPTSRCEHAFFFLVRGKGKCVVHHSARRCRVREWDNGRTWLCHSPNSDSQHLQGSTRTFEMSTFTFVSESNGAGHFVLEARIPRAFKWPPCARSAFGALYQLGSVVVTPSY